MFNDIFKGTYDDGYAEGIEEGKRIYREHTIERFSDFVDDVIENEFGRELLELYRENRDQKELLREARDCIESYKDKYGEINIKIISVQTDQPG